MKSVNSFLRFLTVGAWTAIDKDAQNDHGQSRWQPLAILVAVCAAMILNRYFGSRESLNDFFTHDAAVYSVQQWDLLRLLWWCGWRLIDYVLIPSIVIALLPGERIRDYFLSARGFLKHLPIYVVLYAIVAPCVYLVSDNPGFLHRYPYYPHARDSLQAFLLWELIYGAQFVALEFFFRGFMLRGLRPFFGHRAIFVMIVPYCMIHLGKPLPESLGSIVAGIALGTLAMRTKSIWGGAIIHIAVAATMDAMAIAHCVSNPRFNC
ncbi:MAG: CPBP family intramembrane glutamic endopeptidase [Polyangiales bacterium]